MGTVVTAAEGGQQPRPFLTSRPPAGPPCSRFISIICTFSFLLLLTPVYVHVSISHDEPQSCAEWRQPALATGGLDRLCCLPRARAAVQECSRVMWSPRHPTSEQGLQYRLIAWGRRKTGRWHQPGREVRGDPECCLGSCKGPRAADFVLSDCSVFKQGSNSGLPQAGGQANPRPEALKSVPQSAPNLA